MKLRIDCIDFSYQEVNFNGEEHEFLTLVNNREYIKLNVVGEDIYINSDYIVNFTPLGYKLKSVKHE